VRDYSLPDASGGDAGQGFSIAGFAYDDADGTWWAVNGGLNYDGSSSDRQQSLVHLSADFSPTWARSTSTRCCPISTPNDESPQAVAVDNANGYLWVASPTARVIHCFDKGTGARLPANDITREL
jgi:DNA-binding beta-propeller fold protein YncE